MNVYKISNSTNGNTVAAQSLRHAIAIGLLQMQGIDAVRQSVRADLSKQVLTLAIQVQDAVAAAVKDDATLNPHVMLVDSIELEAATIRSIFRDEATDAWLRDAKEFAKHIKLGKDADGNKMSSLESWKAKASASLDKYLRTIKEAWNLGLDVAFDVSSTGECLPESQGDLKKRIQAAKDEKTDFASEVSASCKACDVFAAHVRSTLIGEGTEANEALCKALSALMPLLQIAVTEAQKGNAEALSLFADLHELTQSVTEKEIVAVLPDGFKQSDIDLPDGETEEAPQLETEAA